VTTRLVQIIPTNGYAKNYSGVNLDSFTKTMTFQKIKRITKYRKAIEIMAEAEGLHIKMQFL
jgi:histidinol dehydrogenase